MIRLAMLGEIGSGKSYVARLFGFPIFNADEQVSFLYKKDIAINSCLPLNSVHKTPLYFIKHHDANS
jgi:dephospho-CoA kinase